MKRGFINVNLWLKFKKAKSLVGLERLKKFNEVVDGAIENGNLKRAQSAAILIPRELSDAEINMILRKNVERGNLNEAMLVAQHLKRQLIDDELEKIIDKLLDNHRFFAATKASLLQARYRNQRPFIQCRAALKNNQNANTD